MIVTIGGIKGGTGKSTLACNLAVMAQTSGAEVLLVDGDRQGTASEFTAARADTLGQSGYSAMRLDFKGMRTQLAGFGRKFNLVIVDVGGVDSMAQREALIHSELVVVPMVPTNFDLWVLEPLLELLGEVRTVNPKLAAVAVLNRCPPRGRDADVAAEHIQSHPGLGLLPARIGARRAISDAAGDGLAVTEQRPIDAKACAEMAFLFNQAFGMRLSIPIATKELIHVAEGP